MDRVAPQGQCTSCRRTLNLRMVKMVKFCCACFAIVFLIKNKAWGGFGGSFLCGMAAKGLLGGNVGGPRGCLGDECFKLKGQHTQRP